MRRLAVVLATLLVTGCGSSSSSISPVAAQSGTTAVSLAGNWGGYFGGQRGEGIELELTQSGTTVEGHGAVFRGNNPQPVFVVGLVDTAGSFELDLFPVDVEVTQSMTMTGNLTGSQLVSSFAVDDAPQGTAITLDAAPTTVPGPPTGLQMQFRANADGRDYAVNSTLSADGTTGQWSSNGTFGSSSSGIATGSTIPFFEDWAQLDLHPATSSTFNNVAHFLFPRVGGSLDPDSGVMLAGRSRSYVVGTVTVSP